MPPFWALLAAERNECVQLHCSEDEEALWTPTDLFLPPWHPRSSNQHPPLPTVRDRYQPSDYHQPAVQLCYLATTYTTPTGTAEPTTPETTEVAAPAPTTTQTNWSAPSSPESPAFEITGPQPGDNNYEPSRNLQQCIDPDTDTEDNVRIDHLGLDWGPGMGWTASDFTTLPVGTVSTSTSLVATSTGGPLPIQPTVIVQSEPASASLPLDDDDDDELPPLIDANTGEIFYHYSSFRSQASQPSSAPRSPVPSTYSPPAVDSDAEDEFDIFDPPTPAAKRRRLFRSPPPQ